ncbi:hypothetical protein ABZY83_26280 [Streptomyces virginiae]|uniref:hypothetical protein n=1 Tax=Streptomyces TaxID=1883 RepID=UPI0006AF1B49|nr:MULTISPECIES: hypothetical protein [unclassified Streptomyces]KOU57022.1 hypothetical protein ADK96_37130 [Streptomyces sp. IGB124]KOU72518.1 hypothetical protein ADK61_26635 [Streptomyces sp. XY66]KOV14408.1 hypothetical protein ADK90_34610 [Streptomyces sp. XY413]KOV29540.1 hypothetical protein ADK97_31935 [Streptomyces sp. H021]
MTLVTALILVAAAALVGLLALAPTAPARRNPVPGRRNRATRRRAASRLDDIPRPRGIHHHAR